MNKKVAIYARVSTEDQHLENQIKQLENLALSYNNKIVRIYKEKVSGGSTTRPEFHRMLFDARMKHFDIVYVWSLDRFSREGIRNTLSYLERLRKYNVGLKSLQESWLDTTEDGMGELLIAVLSWVAKQERKCISERTKAGLRYAKNVGKRGPDKKPRKKIGYLKRWDK